MRRGRGRPCSRRMRRVARRKEALAVAAVAGRQQRAGGAARRPRARARATRVRPSTCSHDTCSHDTCSRSKNSHSKYSRVRGPQGGARGAGQRGWAEGLLHRRARHAHATARPAWHARPGMHAARRAHAGAMEELLMVMKERFLAGEDGRHFDYRIVDECDRYDDGEQVRGHVQCA